MAVTVHGLKIAAEALDLWLETHAETKFGNAAWLFVVLQPRLEDVAVEFGLSVFAWD